MAKKKDKAVLPNFAPEAAEPQGEMAPADSPEELTPQLSEEFFEEMNTAIETDEKDAVEQFLDDNEELMNDLAAAEAAEKIAMAAKTEIAMAAESDKAENLANVKEGTLSICGQSLTGDEEAAVRAVVELHFQRKGLRFHGAGLRQNQLDSILKDPTFVGKLGKLRKYIK